MQERRHRASPDHAGCGETSSNKSIQIASSARATGRSEVDAQAHRPLRPAEADLATLSALKQLREKDGPCLPPVKACEEEGATELRFDDPRQDIASAMLAVAMGTSDAALLRRIMQQIAEGASRDGSVDTAGVDFGLGVIRATAPRDPIELMLVTQMQAVHAAAMTAARRLAGSTTVPAQDSNAGCMNRCMRTFVAQVEALKRHRSSAEQKVVVQHQHVTVSSQQAVVGIRQGGGGTE